MKTLSIYVDIRKSKNFTLKEKKEKYTKLYTQFSSYKPKKNNIYWRTTMYIGDGIILIFNADQLGNKDEVIKLMEEINDKVKTVETNNNIKMGIGISYSKAFEEGNSNLFISPSIDAAAYGVNLANKYIVRDQKWKWVLSLKVGDDGTQSIKELKNIIVKEEKIKHHESSSKKNLWFEFNN